MNSLSSHIKNKRQELGLKTKDLAAHLGIDQALISKYENNKRLPTRDQVIQLAALLQLDKHNLLVLYTKELLLKYVSADEISLKALDLVQEELRAYQKEKIPVIKKLDKVLKQIDKLKKELVKLHHLDSNSTAEALELAYTYHSNKIDGNTLTLEETKLVIDEGLTISGKSMREHLEAVNHKDAIQFIKDCKEKQIEINEDTLLQLRSIVLRGIQGNKAGKYRNIQVSIPCSTYTPPQAFLVAQEMEALFNWYRANKSLIHPVALAAEMHQRLYTIQPFVEGNGRTARLLMNVILLKHGYVIANIQSDENSRDVYFEALEKSRVEPNKESFHNLIAITVLTDVERYLQIISQEKD